MIDRQKIDERDIFFFRKKKEEYNIHPLRCLCILYHLPIFFFVISALSKKKWREKERMDPIPYIEHSILSIDRKIFVKYRTLPFF